MATTTNRGIYHPTSTDSIAPLETHFALLASSVSDRLAMSGRKAFTGPAAAAGTVAVAVTFDTPYTSIPLINASVEGTSVSSPYVTTIHSVTTTGFSAVVYRVAGSTAENLYLNWITVGA